MRSKSPTHRPRTLSIGGATYDLFVRTTKDLLGADKKDLSLPLGAKIKVSDVIETCGGGAANTSVGFSRLGCSAHFGGVIASDQWGERLLKNFQTEKVDTSTATIVENEMSSFSIILSVGSGERVILYDPGTNAHIHDANFDRTAAAGMDWVYLNSLQEDSCVIQDDIIALMDQPQKPGLTWNPGGCQIEAGLGEPNNRHLLKHTDLFLANKEEILAFTKAASVEEAMKIVLDAGAQNVCVTDGRHGVKAMDKTSTYFCPSFPDDQVDIVDTTGAGDAFGVAATWALISGFNLPKALQAGTINATSVIGRIGAEPGLLTDIEMQKRLSDVQLDVQVLPQ